MFNKATIITEHARQVIDVTEVAKNLVTAKGSGLALYYVPHTTTTLLMCEDDEELRSDLVQVATRWLKDCGPFRHIRKNNPNAEAHILSAVCGHSVMVAVNNGQLDLGVYQNLLLLELDGPKERQLRLCFIADR